MQQMMKPENKKINQTFIQRLRLKETSAAKFTTPSGVAIRNEGTAAHYKPGKILIKESGKNYQKDHRLYPTLVL